MDYIAAFETVSHKYGDSHVLEDVTFELKRGTVTTLIGPNGAGKTTLARLLLGLQKPSGGNIVSNHKKVAYAPQKFAINSDLPLDVNNFMSLTSPNFRERELSDTLLKFSNFDVLKDSAIRSLSGGQLQRIALASAILQMPELLVLDEPTQSLDVDSHEDFYSIIEKIKKLKSMTIFIISHDLFTVMKKSDQVLCINHHLCCKGKPTHTVIKGSENIGIYKHTHDHTHGE